MLLVVAGHYRHALEPAYWTTFYIVRHQFTMPLFFLLSGFLFRFASTTGDSNYYAVFFTKKVPRLVYPYLAISLIILAAKLAAGAFFTLQHPANLSTLLYMAVNPLKGHVTMLWFMYTLALIFFIYPLLKALVRSDLAVFALSVIMMYLPSTEYFCIKPMLDHMPFFLFGMLAARRVDFDEMKGRSALLALAGGAAIFAAVFLTRAHIDVHIGRLFMGLAGSIAVIGAARLLVRPAGNAAGRIFESIGFYSMSIYLLHTLFLGAARITQHQVLGIHEHFWAGAAAGIVAAIVVPLFLEKHVLRKYALTRKYILGLKADAPRSSTVTAGTGTAAS